MLSEITFARCGIVALIAFEVLDLEMLLFNVDLQPGFIRTLVITKVARKVSDVEMDRSFMLLQNDFLRETLVTILAHEIPNFWVVTIVIFPIMP